MRFDEDYLRFQGTALFDILDPLTPKYPHHPEWNKKRLFPSETKRIIEDMNQNRARLRLRWLVGLGLDRVRVKPRGRLKGSVKKGK